MSANTNLKTSILINRQLPEFIREEYPLFQAFLEAYYEFLEQKQGTQKNDLVSVAKSLRTIQDVDASIADFESNFFNSFATLFPNDASIDKALLIKKVLPLYLSKGSEKSFQFLFRLLFGKEVDVIYPKDNILRASDGKWTTNEILRTTQNIFSYHTGNGSDRTFTLAQPVSASEIVVYINNVVQTTGFYTLKEYSRLVFNVAPANNAEIKVLYINFDVSLFRNRKITGSFSGASALIETASKRVITDEINLGFPIELVVSKNSIVGTFANGEDLLVPIIDADGNTIDVRTETFSIIRKINVIDGGESYRIGDLAIITGGNPKKQALGEISSIFSGTIQFANVLDGGAIFTTTSNVTLSPNNQVATIVVGNIDTSGEFGANTFVVATDLVSNHSSNLISSADYGFPSPKIASQNALTRIADALSFQTLSVGSIKTLILLSATGVVNTAPILDANGAIFQPMIGSTERSVKSLKGIGRIDVITAGTGYIPGDEVVFGANPINTYGEGAAAVVGEVTSTGGVKRIYMQQSRVSGTANIESSNVTIVGTGTQFDTELSVGDRIIINNETRIVNTIVSATSINVNVAFSTTSTDRRVGVYERYPVGGINYIQNTFPTVAISSPTGNGANIVIHSCVSDGEQLSAAGTRRPGEILSVRVKDPGQAYQYEPAVFFQSETGSGARGNVEIETAITDSESYWRTSDSLLSSSDRRLQGQDYYINYSYVLSSQVEFSRYKDIFKQLIHPAGYINYSWLNKENVLQKNVVTTAVTTPFEIDELSYTIAGTVNVNSTIFVIGTGTKFNTANSLGYLSIGSNVAVNGVIRTVNSIISNTELTVSSPFNTLANVQTMIILTSERVLPDLNNLATDNLSTQLITTEDDIILSTESSLIFRI
jgi:hypothetical protein